MTAVFDPSCWSLTRRQLVVIGGALTILALILGVGGAWFIHGVSERMSDRILGASVQSIIETIGVEQGQVTLDMPPSAFGMLEDRARDNVYYSIHQGARVLTGYPKFPRANIEGMRDGEMKFRYDEFLGQRVRVATQIRRLPQSSEPVVVEVAETTDERAALARAMLLGLALLEGAMVSFAAFLVWPAIKWGLQPVTKVQAQLDARDPDKLDFTPLDAGPVPPELSGLINGFNQLLHHLDSATERSRRFTADASHQMRTPLAVLRAHIELLQKQFAGHLEAEASLVDIQEATERLQRLLTQLLALARVEQDQSLGSNPDGCDVTEIARQVCIRFASTALDAGMEIHLESSQDAFLGLEAVLFEELLSNLIDNAIRYGTAADTILVRLVGNPGEIRLEVEDNGPGIPDEMHDYVLERFSRLGRDQSKPGSGLGLSIALAICERVGAVLNFAAAPQRGLIVQVTFPVSKTLIPERKSATRAI